MANTFKLKTSSVAGKVPATSDLQLSELAWNSYDGKLYGKKDSGTPSIIEIGAGGGGGASSLDGLSDVAITSAAKGQFIVHNGTEFVNSRTIESNAAATVPLTLKAHASQSGNIFQIQNSSASNFISVDSAGMATFSGGGWNKHAAVFTGAIDNPGSLATTGVYMGTNGNYAWLRLMGGNNGILDFGQTNGNIYRSRFLGVNDGLQIALGYNNYKIYLGNISASVPGTLHLLPMTTSSQGIVVKGLASQTANLFEAQNSSGTNIGSIGANGDTYHTSSSAAGVPLAVARPSSPTNYGFVVRHANGKRMFGVGANGALAGEVAGWGCHLEMGNDDYAMVRLGYHTSTGAFRLLSNTDTIQTWESPGGTAGVYTLTLARNTASTSWNFSLGGFASSVRFDTTLYASRYVENSANAFNTSLAPSSGTLTVNTALGNAVLGALSASVTTWAFTNVPTDNGRVTKLTAVIAGNSSFTYGDACSVNGTAITDGIQWSGGSAPTSTSNTDIIEFTIVRDSAGTVKVFGVGSTNFS